MAQSNAPAIIERAVEELWWMDLVQATLAIFFGVTAIFWPALTLVTLVYLFSAFILSVGLAETFSGLISIGRRATWWVTFLIGVVAAGAGVYLVRNPNLSFSTFILVVGLTLIARGLLDAVSAFTERRDNTYRVLSGIVALAAIAAGIIILTRPVSGGLAFVWILGLYALVYGALTMAIAFNLRADWEIIRTALSDGNNDAVTGGGTPGRGRGTRTA